MNSLGFYYNKNYLTRNPVYLNYLYIKNSEPSNKQLFIKLNQSVEKLFDNDDISSKYVPLMHHSCIFPMVEQDGYKKEFDAFMKQLPSQIVHGYHFLFDKLHKIDGENFINEFNKLTPFLKKYKFQSVVVHPPSKRNSRLRKIMKNLTDPIFLNDLKESKIVLSIENMRSRNGFYSDVRKLVWLRRKLEKRYNKLGVPELMNQIGFCFDTGHLMTFLNDNKIDPNENIHGLEEFSKYIKVYHIHTNCGHRDDHLLVRNRPLKIPPNKKQTEYGDNQEILIKNSKLIMDWVRFCLKHQNPNWDLELLNEIDDYIDLKALQDSMLCYLP